MQHKLVAESKNLESKAQELATYLANVSDTDKIEPRTTRRSLFNHKEPDSRVHIRGDNRFRAEKRHRQQVKRQLIKAVSEPDNDVVVEGIAYCQPWDWRW